METGLGSQSTLAKIDKLRELNVGSIIPLPQLIVVGDQSSGKSSVLESLTGFSFPRAAGLCTRYATQITCCRDSVKSIVISIIPRPNADEDLRSRLVAFHRRPADLGNDELARIFYEANLAMGIRMTTDDEDSELCAFSEDILKIEISGPDQNHLTVIDVPGIFRVSTPGLTTESDIALVENMVKRYMRNNRTIILAVMPCNVDIATQEIVKLSEAADPDGMRTMGVLTKPDLATEVATRAAVIDLIVGKRSSLKLGYYVVKNRSADDNTSSLAQRAASEHAFFAAPPWSDKNVRDRCGTAALKERLSHLLTKVSKQEFPNVKADIEQRLRQCKLDLETMGPARSDQASQRLYLGHLATQFERVTQAALNGHYAGHETFKSRPDLKLITRVMKLHTIFAIIFSQRAHLRKLDFSEGCPEPEEENPLTDNDTIIPFKIPLAAYHELQDIICTEMYDCPEPESEPIMAHIKEIYDSTRGPDLGTFSGSIFSTVFEEESKKWEPLTLSHVSNVIVLVHDYVFQLLCHLCPEEQVRDHLWNGFLIEKLSELYREAMDHARFLLKLERGRPITFNHNFNDKLQKKRTARLLESMKEIAIQKEGDNHLLEVDIQNIREKGRSIRNEQQTCEDILDTFVSYYNVARERFVDVIYQQVISHFLLNAKESPLKAFGPAMVMGLDDAQLELISGEDEESREKRTTLTREIESLSGALKVLRA